MGLSLIRDGAVVQVIGEQYVYCINRPKNASSAEKYNAHFRWRWNLDVNGWLFTNLQNQDDVRTYDTRLRVDNLVKIKKALYNGYPFDGSGLQGGKSDEEFYADTQYAIFWLIYFGNGTYPNVSEYLTEGARAILESTMEAPDSTLYLYMPDSNTSEALQPTVGLRVWSASDTPSPGEPGLGNASVSVSAKKAITGDDGAPALAESNTDKQFAFKITGISENTSKVGVGNGLYKDCYTRFNEGDAVYFGDFYFTEGAHIHSKYLSLTRISRSTM